MQKEKREEKGLLRKQGTGKNEGGFISIEKKISYRFGRTIMICCIVLGVVASILSYISSVSAISETINNTSDVAADYVAAEEGQEKGDDYFYVAYNLHWTPHEFALPTLPKNKKWYMTLHTGREEIGRAHV